MEKYASYCDGVPNMQNIFLICTCLHCSYFKYYLFSVTRVCVSCHDKQKPMCYPDVYYCTVMSKSVQ